MEPAGPGQAARMVRGCLGPYTAFAGAPLSFFCLLSHLKEAGSSLLWALSCPERDITCMASSIDLAKGGPDKQVIGVQG